MPGSSISIGPSDLVSGRAFVKLSGAAKVKLCSLAGAPWSDSPKAALSPLQTEILTHAERVKIIHGGSGVGKSVVGGCELLCEAVVPGSITGVVAGRYEHVGHEFQYLVLGLQKLFPKHAFTRFVFKNQQNYHEYCVTTIWGSSSRGFSIESDEGASLLGRQFNLVVGGEGSHIPPYILEHRILRAMDRAIGDRGRETGRLLLCTTPKEFEGCAAAEWERVMKETAGHPELLHYGAVSFARSIWLREADVLENPTYNREVYALREATLDPAAFDEQYRGKMSFKSGRIFKEFDDSRCVVPVFPDAIRSMRLGVGFDTGSFTGIVLAGINSKNQKSVLGEVYTMKETIGTSLTLLKELLVEVLSPIGLTSFEACRERIELWMVDPASQHKQEIIEFLNVPLSIPGSKGGAGKFELLPSLEVIRSWTENNEMLVSSSCPIFLDQLRKYSWKSTKPLARASAGILLAPAPRKEFDHLIDAFRFIAVPLSILGPLTVTQPGLSLHDSFREEMRESMYGPLREILNEAREKEAYA